MVCCKWKSLYFEFCILRLVNVYFLDYLFIYSLYAVFNMHLLCNSFAIVVIKPGYQPLKWELNHNTFRLQHFLEQIFTCDPQFETWTQRKQKVDNTFTFNTIWTPVPWTKSKCAGQWATLLHATSSQSTFYSIWNWSRTSFVRAQKIKCFHEKLF